MNDSANVAADRAQRVGAGLSRDRLSASRATDALVAIATIFAGTSVAPLSVLVAA
jgi:hypothetical protein